MAHPFFVKVFPIFAGVENHDKVDSSNEPTQGPRRRDSKKEITKEEILWRGNPYWIINFGYYIFLIIVGAVLNFGIVAAQGLLNPSEITDEIVLGIHLAVVGLWLILFLFGLIRFIHTKTTVYELTPTRISVIQGLINRPERDAFLYKVKDHRHNPNRLKRLFGRSDMFIRTSDDDFGERTFIWIQNGYLLKRYLDFYVHGESMKMPAGQLISTDDQTYHHEEP